MMEIGNKFKRVLNRFRPQLVKAIHDQIIDDYIQEYKLDNNGEAPPKENIRMFSSILVAQKVASNEADKIINGLIEEAENEILKNRKNESRKIFIVNTIVFVMILSLDLSFILQYIKEQGINLIGDYQIFSVPNFINAILILIVLVANYIHTINKK